MAYVEDKYIEQAIADFDSIKQALIDCGVEVPHGTDTKEYAKLISQIGNKKYQMAEFVVNDTEATIHAQIPLVITIEANLPTNARVKRVEIPDIVNETDEYLALEDMVSKDPFYSFDEPYFIMYPKGKAGQYCSAVAAAVIFSVYGNSYYEMTDNFSDKTIRVYYEIEE